MLQIEYLSLLLIGTDETTFSTDAIQEHSCTAIQAYDGAAYAA